MPPVEDQDKIQVTLRRLKDLLSEAHTVPSGKCLQEVCHRTFCFDLRFLLSDDLTNHAVEGDPDHIRLLFQAQFSKFPGSGNALLIPAPKLVVLGDHHVDAAYLALGRPRKNGLF